MRLEHHGNQPFVSIDCETASLRTDAQVWQIGLVFYRINYNPDGPYLVVDGSHTLHMEMNHLAQSDMDTIKWMEKNGTIAVYEQWHRNAMGHESDLDMTSWRDLHLMLKKIGDEGMIIVTKWIDSDLTWIKHNLQTLGFGHDQYPHTAKLCLGTMCNMVKRFYGRMDQVYDRVNLTMPKYLDQNRLRDLRPHIGEYDAIYQMLTHFEIEKLLWKAP